MKVQLKGFIKNLFANSALQIINISSEEEDILNFFEKIYPFTTEHDLIRIGGHGDGSYLLPNDLKDIKYCFSPGVSTTINLEVELATRGIQCYMADNSVDDLPLQHPLFDFEKKHLGLKNTKDYMTLESWVNHKIDQDHNDLLLQMDVEGAEYAVLESTPGSLLERFRIMVIEFHAMDMLLNKVAFQTIQSVFTKLLGLFYVVHIHPNNYSPAVSYKNLQIPPLMEFTFLRKDRAKKLSYTHRFPHALDINNIPDNRKIVLPECWYKS